MQHPPTTQSNLIEHAAVKCHQHDRTPLPATPRAEALYIFWVYIIIPTEFAFKSLLLRNHS